MRIHSRIGRVWASLVAVLLLLPPQVIVAQQGETPPAPLRQEEIEQLVAPIALYPDPLISQILMAATYPIDIVQADRWVKQNSNLKGDALTAALEKQNWDPSIKSLVNFPQVLSMMSEKLDLTQRLGDAFLADEKKVMDAIQSLRAKAQGEGNLKTTKEQNVTVEEKVIRIEPADPQVIYVPTYNPTVVYGAWPYPAYPPYSYYPPGYAYPGYVAGSMLAMGAGVAMGAAWGYAWGRADWHGGNVKYNFEQNININNKIDRSKYSQNSRNGNWQHNANNRKGVAYRDQSTAQRYNRGTAGDQARSREQYRGRAEQGRQDLANRSGTAGDRAANAGNRSGAAGDRAANAGNRASAGDRANVSSRAGGGGAGAGAGSGSSARGSAFSGVNGGGSGARASSSRGSASRGSYGGGGARGGGGGGRGGGGRR